ncbi:hypothetical protein Q7142_004616 [Vibrio parahaemolyticus]|uniref:hypothetical protein n=3 Tax=Vibrio parahaemolyticus TaxID=670 RepID=UPI0027E41C7D|nr:hypothetical protein [Vibrio parahaemolyticus]ELA7626305.1 hypothetical protein [Vibrio parahaemolyticus]
MRRHRYCVVHPLAGRYVARRFGVLNFLNKKSYVQSVAKDMAPKLCAKFGKKPVYSFQEISWALSETKRSDDQFYKSVSYGMLLPYSNELATELQEDLGDLLEFQKSVGELLFNVSEVPSFESYLLYAEVNSAPKCKVTNTTLDSSGGVNFLDFCGGD